MKIYKTQSEVEKDIKDGVLIIEGDVKFECSISVEASIVVKNGDINALDINAWNIKADNIKAEDIKAGNIKAGNISYYAFCFVYSGINCNSIKARRSNAPKPICLDGELTIKKPDDKTQEALELLKSQGYKIIKE